MILTIDLGGQQHQLTVPAAIITEATDFFTTIDTDMDHGWHIDGQWIQQPNALQRRQIVTEKLLAAVTAHNDQLALLMAAYLLRQWPTLTTIKSDSQETSATAEFYFQDQASVNQHHTEPNHPPSFEQIDQTTDAFDKANRAVSHVFRIGKGWQFAIFDQTQMVWQNSPLFANEQQAQEQRQQEVVIRYTDLVQQDANQSH
jgi:antirestriction protein